MTRKVRFRRSALHRGLRTTLEDLENVLGYRAEDLERTPASQGPDFASMELEEIELWRQFIAIIRIAEKIPNREVSLARVLVGSPEETNDEKNLWKALQYRAYWENLNNFRRAKDVSKWAKVCAKNRNSGKRKWSGQTAQALQESLEVHFLKHARRFSDSCQIDVIEHFLRANPDIGLSAKTVKNMTLHPNPAKRRTRRGKRKTKSLKPKAFGKV